MIDSIFRNINRLFVLSFKISDDDLMRDSYEKYEMSLVEIKDINALTDNKLFLDQPVKLSKMSRNNDYEIGNSSYFLYLQNYYKLIGIDLSRQTNTTISQQINFTGKSKEDDGATMFYIAKKQQKLF